MKRIFCVLTPLFFFERGAVCFLEREDVASAALCTRQLKAESAHLGM